MKRPPFIPIVIAMPIAMSCTEDGGSRGPETTAAIAIQSGFAEVHGGRGTAKTD